MGKISETRIKRQAGTDASSVLVSQARKGDQYAMHQLYELYAKAMLNSAFRVLNSKEDAEDVLQESFIKAFKNLGSFEAESTFGAWLKRIVVNCSINKLRKRELLVFYETVPDYEVQQVEVNLSLNEQQLLALLRKGLSSLPSGYRTVFTLYVIEGYDHEEISQILNIGKSTSISQLSRAKQKLKVILTNIHHYE